jgi:hypothetical protein
VSDLYSGLSARFVLVDVLVPGRTNARLKEYRSRRTENRSTRSTAPANPRPHVSPSTTSPRDQSRISNFSVPRPTTTLYRAVVQQPHGIHTATGNPHLVQQRTTAHTPHTLYTTAPGLHIPETHGIPRSADRLCTCTCTCAQPQPQLQTYLEQLPATRVGRTASMHAPMLCRGRIAI